MTPGLGNEAIPAQIRSLAEWLIGNGYSLDRALFPRAFADYYLKLRKGDLYVVLSSDRDLTTVDVGLSDSLPPLLVDLWRACARRTGEPQSLPTVDEQVAILMDDLALFEAAVTENRSELVNCVKRLQANRTSDSWRLADDWNRSLS